MANEEFYVTVPDGHQLSATAGPNPSSMLYEGTAPLGPNDYQFQLLPQSNRGAEWDYRMTFKVTSSVPEPAAVVLLGLGLLVGVLRRRFHAAA